MDLPVHRYIPLHRILFARDCSYTPNFETPGSSSQTVDQETPSAKELVSDDIVLFS